MLSIIIKGIKSWQRPTLPCLKTKYHRRKQLSRSSSGWDRVFICCYCHQETNKYKTFLCTIIVIKPIELLVLVSFMHCCTSTSNLSTWWSSTTLMGKSSIQVGFPLRCFQRLSCPYIATQRCSWRNNWYTRGTFIPVLSY